MSGERETKEVRIRGLGPMSDDACVVVLEEVSGSRLLPIFAARSDGEAIARRVAGLVPPRPLTHELLLSVVETLGWSVLRVVITEVRDGAFIARIDLGKDGAEQPVDARPTDALNLALRAGCPIFVAERVFKEGETVLKPIGGEDVEKFKKELETADLSKIFADLETKPAPEEPGPPS